MAWAKVKRVGGDLVLVNFDHVRTVKPMAYGRSGKLGAQLMTTEVSDGDPVLIDAEGSFQAFEKLLTGSNN